MGAEGWRAEACGDDRACDAILDSFGCRRRLLKVCKSRSQYPHRKQSYGTKKVAHPDLNDP